MPDVVEAIALAVLILATSVWVGGYVAIIVVARSATRVLDAPTRVEFFRSLGRMYFWVGAPALIIALVAGGVLARDLTEDGLFAAIVVIALVLLACFAVAVLQARRMTRLRRSLMTASTDANLSSRVARGARAAGVLRGVLGLLSLALVILGAFLAVR